MAITTTTALTIAAVAAVASTAVATASAIQQGQAAKKQANFQAAIQRQQADRERQIAAAGEEDFRRRQQRLLSSSRAAAGGSGLDTSTGSSLLAAEDFAAETELQALRIRSGGETQATRLEQQAALTRLSGRNAERASFMQAGGSLLQGIGRTSLLMGGPSTAAIA